VIIAQGGSYAGWSLYLKDGVAHYCHNFVSLARYTVGGESAIPAGEHQLRLELAYDGVGWQRGNGDPLRRRGQDRRRPDRANRAAHFRK
jgi:hypothetical protein